MAKLMCSFCTKDEDKVKKLVAGPSVYICDECIDLAAEIIAEERAQDGASIADRVLPAESAELEEIRNMNELITAFADQIPAFDTPEGLAALRENEGFFPRQPNESAEVQTASWGDRSVDVRIIRPEYAATGVYLEMHGGGWCIGSASGSDIPNTELVDELGIATVSVEYRLAPEHPYPAGPDDCETAARWLLENTRDEFGTDRLVIGGGSAGAHLAASTLLRLRGDGAVDAFLGANLIFGAFDLGMTPSQRAGADALVIPLRVLEACLANYLPGLDEETRRDPAISPLYADLTGLPPALFTVGDLDPLLDDSLFMASRWLAAGNQAEVKVYPEAVHGFPSFPTAIGRRARDHMKDWIGALIRSAT